MAKKSRRRILRHYAQVLAWTLVVCVAMASSVCAAVICSMAAEPEVVELTPEVVVFEELTDVDKTDEPLPATEILETEESTGVMPAEMDIISVDNTAQPSEGQTDISKDAIPTAENISSRAEPADASDYAEPQLVRCTGYCDNGITKSGEPVHDGVIAGKQEWLGYTAVLYAVNADGSIGEVIKTGTFLDTGYGINGSLVNGTSIDVWHSNEDAIWEWAAAYGDYVYLQIIK